MSTSDLLTKLVLHEKQIVTYRTLSRQQSIHVNQAKSDLAAFYQSTKSSNASSIYATFVVSGLGVPAPKAATNGMGDDGMELDEPSSSQPQEAETCGWGADKMTLCTEEGLESAKAGFARVRSVHVYSLSAAPIKDPSMLSTTLEPVRKADAAASQDQLRAYGVVIGDVSVMATKAGTKGKGKAVANPPVAVAVVKPAPLDLKKPDVLEKKAAPSRNGTLNFGSAKPKEEPKPAKQPVPTAVEEAPKEVKKEVKVEEAKKGTKRPSPAPEPQRSTSGLNRKRGHAVSSDEDDVAVAAKPAASKTATTARPKSKQHLPPARKQEDMKEEDDVVPVRPAERRANGKGQGSVKAKAPSANEASLRAMFDEPSDVEMQPEPLPSPPKEEAPQALDPADDDDEREEEPEEEIQAVDKPKAKPRAKAKPKEGAVIMKDGKKKKRVVKSRMSTNERGYMMMEDYSEYETVSESEELTGPEKPKKVAAKKQDKSKETNENMKQEEVPKAKPKPRTSATGGGKKGGGKLSDYFNKK